jgi:Domain of unknown function (DUF4258)
MRPLLLLFSGHALRRMALRFVTEVQVRAVVEADDVIEDYPDDTPYPSSLYLGFDGTRPLHVVAAHDRGGQWTIVITVYEPDTIAWDATLRRRIDG